MSRSEDFQQNQVAVLGATGSIGASTLDLIARHPDRFRAAVLTAHRQTQKMAQLCQQFLPDTVVMTNSQAAQELRTLLATVSWGKSIQVLDGEAALAEVVAAPQIDTVVAGIVGAAGLGAALSAARCGKRILLANKEALVMAGALMVNAAKAGQAVVLPIDSEHNAIFQCLGENYRCFEPPAGVTRLLLTASGGPFRSWPLEDIASATVAQAIAHPNWSMGRKISVDSATMMNKGLELIEAHWLFALPESQIQVVVHPQSVVHSMVEFDDGSTLAQLGSPDMRTPIACALSWPQRISTPVARLDWTTLGSLQFEPPDDLRFPSLSLARQALQMGGAASAVLNAANEIAVEAFLEEKIRFGDIFRVVTETLESIGSRHSQAPACLIDLLALDQESRVFARGVCAAQRVL
jgi:1-deoxy-D-xylulose-5-phosphate reductoisomerase